MGAEIIIDGDASSTARYRVMPASKGMTALIIPRVNSTFVGRNWARNGALCSIVGSPVIGASYTRFRGLTNYIQTGVAESKEATIFSVVRSYSGNDYSSVAQQPMYYGTYKGAAVEISATSFGVGMWSTASTNIAASATRSDGAGGLTSAGAQITTTATTWASYVHKIAGDAGLTTITDYTNNVTDDSSTPANRITTNNKFRVGSGFDDFGGYADVAWWAYFPRVLDDSEIEDNVAFIKEDLASLASPINV